MSAVEGFFAIAEYIYPLSMLEGLAPAKSSLCLAMPPLQNARGAESSQTRLFPHRKHGVYPGLRKPKKQTLSPCMVYRQAREQKRTNRNAMLQKKKKIKTKLSPSLRSMPPF